MKKILLFLGIALSLNAQAQEDTITKRYTVHFQHTMVEQSHPNISGISTLGSPKTLSKNPEDKLSSTTTLFIGKKFGKNSEFYFNPEVAGGEGLSNSCGMAGFPNGESFRVGSPKPQFYIARLFWRQTIPLSKDYVYRPEDQNILPQMNPVERLVITVGKFSLSDIFDANYTSHDPKTSFLNWALMDAAAWDYPSNTRGYTYATSFKFVKKNYILRFSTAMASMWSNGPVTYGNDILPTPKNYLDRHGENLELILPIKHDFAHFFKVMVFANHAPMALYSEATKNVLDTINHPTWNNLGDRMVSIGMDTARNNSGPYYKKYGIVVSYEKPWRKNTFFTRASWNDGQHETWMYTEIDRSIAIGTFLSGSQWKRNDDKCRIGFAINDISQAHKDYLKAGGYGFIIGDGKNYPKGLKPEMIFEIQYSWNLTKQLIFSPDYQLCINPGYNAARGAVNIFSIRAHFEI